MVRSGRKEEISLKRFGYDKNREGKREAFRQRGIKLRSKGSGREGEIIPPQWLSRGKGERDEGYGNVENESEVSFLRRSGAIRAVRGKRNLKSSKGGVGRLPSLYKRRCSEFTVGRKDRMDFVAEKGQHLH